MTPQSFQTEAIFRGIGDTFLSILLLMLMLAPFLVSIVANVGRRAWPSYRKRQEARALLAAPRRTA